MSKRNIDSPSGIFGLGEDLQQLVVGQEEESWEEEALLFQVHVEALQDHIQELVGFPQLLHHLLNRSEEHTSELQSR